MNPKREVFQFKDYEEYLRTQRHRARRSRSVTASYAWHRARICERLREFCPEARTMLCLGARSDLEVLEFRASSYDAEGIDLFGSEHIIECDMSKIDQHPRLSAMTFDVFTSIHSIEHCLDFEGFSRGLRLCKRALACVTPQTTAPTAWDCSSFAFAHPDAGTAEIAAAFPGFEVAWRDVAKRNLMFILLRQA